jgi:hypothetical protein
LTKSTACTRLGQVDQLASDGASVLQIPTPRNSLYDAVALAIPHPEDRAATIQERAYTSPIWYTP